MAFPTNSVTARWLRLEFTISGLGHKGVLAMPFEGVIWLTDNKKILIMNLSKGRIGEQNSNLLGSMLVTKIYLAAMSRAEVTAAELKNLPDFYLYVDEFQNFATDTFGEILSEARKYRLSLTLARRKGSF